MTIFVQWNYLFQLIYNPIIMSDKFNQIREIVENLTGDVQKFYESGNNAAGTRIRVALQKIKNEAQEMRKEIQDMKNGAQ
jgi:vacuolar-type H+-ATPase subunit E/Vma4